MNIFLPAAGGIGQVGVGGVGVAVLVVVGVGVLVAVGVGVPPLIQNCFEVLSTQWLILLLPQKEATS